MFDMIPFRRNNIMGKGDNLENFFDSFFNNDFFAPMNIHGFGNGFRADLKENDDSYVVEADLPGMKKDSINVDYNNNYLTISAKRDDAKEEKNENFVRRERRYGEFRRSFYVDNVKKENIKASFDNGVLKIVLPKENKGKNENTRIDIN